MNLNAQPGDKIVFLYPWNGWSHDIEKAAKHLKVGGTYTVDRVDEHKWHTRVYLREVPGEYFNSVQFVDAGNLPPLAEYIRTLAPSVEYSSGHKESPSPKAHAAALEWLSERVEHIAEAVQAAQNLVDAMNTLMASSEGVTGLHRNGDVATWDELTRGGRFGNWLSFLDDTQDALAALDKPNQSGEGEKQP